MSSPATVFLENDLPSLANRAAIELDNLTIGRSVSLDAIQSLAIRISQSVTDVADPGSPSSLLNVRTAVLLNRAFGEATPGVTGQTLDELLKNARELTSALTTINLTTAAERLDEVRRLRNFCVALSRQALAREITPEDRPQHPFRR